ncbi:MAG TPA: HD domain-containing protein [Limnochordia bacterium]|nr:HD domain-containing protein [Limnochordia bacterium]
MSVTIAEVKAHPLIDAYIRKADEHLAAMGYNEHGYRHVELVSRIAKNVLLRLGHPKREAELAEIAGYVHDVGNAVGRANHESTGAVIVTMVLRELGMDLDEVAIVAGAVGNHEEKTGSPVNNVSAALILADKSDVHRTRVRKEDLATFDIHDRVNYAVVHSFLKVEPSQRTITLELTIETEICPVMEYFEIFLSRMLMCRRAAEFLGCTFHLEINGAALL